MSEATRGLESIVTVTLESRDGGTEITLRHANVPDDELGRSHKDGWSWYLNTLAERFEKRQPADARRPGRRKAPRPARFDNPVDSTDPSYVSRAVPSSEGPPAVDPRHIAVRRPAQERRPHQRLDDAGTGIGVQAPQAGRLWNRQPQPWHLEGPPRARSTSA